MQSSLRMKYQRSSLVMVFARRGNADVVPQLTDCPQHAVASRLGTSGAIEDVDPKSASDAAVSFTWVNAHGIEQAFARAVVTRCQRLKER